MLYEQGVEALCPYSKMGHTIRMCPVGNYPIVFGRESSHYCRKIRVDFEDEGRPESTSEDGRPRINGG